MSTINTGLNIDSNTWKQSNRKKTTNYTARDFESAKEELLKLRDDLTEKWTSTDEADPGIVLIKEAAQVIDLLSYNQDKQILECFPNSVTQLKNARQLYGLVKIAKHIKFLLYWMSFICIESFSNYFIFTCNNTTNINLIKIRKSCQISCLLKKSNVSLTYHTFTPCKFFFSESIVNAN